jgi:hypothetical protein
MLEEKDKGVNLLSNSEGSSSETEEEHESFEESTRASSKKTTIGNQWREFTRYSKRDQIEFEDGRVTKLIFLQIVNIDKGLMALSAASIFLTLSEVFF